MKRRELMIGSGAVAIAALAGQTPHVQAQNSDSLPEDVEAIFDLLPASSAIDTEYHQIAYWDLADVDDPDDLGFGTAIVGDIDDLDVADVEDVATVRTMDDPRVVGAAGGEFDRPEPGEEIDEEDGWRIAVDDHVTVASSDDIVAFAGEGPEDDRIEAVETAIDAAAGDADDVFEEVSALETALGRLADRQVVYFIPDVDPDDFPGDIGEHVESFGAGFEEPPAEMDGTVEVEYVFEETEDADLGEEKIEELIESIERGTVEELTIDRADGLLFATATIETPPDRDREAAPEAQIRADADADKGVVTIEHHDGEEIPADELELWVNGEFAERQFDDEYEAVEPGDTFEIETGALANVYLRWIDEDEDVYYDYVNVIVGNDAFETAYDVSASRVELTYTAEQTADTDRLELLKRIRDDEEPRIETEQLEEPIDALEGTLETGDSIVIENVDIDDTIQLELDIPSGPDGVTIPRTTILSFRPRSPRMYVYREPNRQPIAMYRSDQSHDASAFRVRYDGSDNVRQLDEDHDTLESGDEIRLDAAEFGTEITIEWTEPDEPAIVTEHVVEPQMRIETSYDDEDGIVTVENADGEEVDADDLELRFDGERADTQPDDQHAFFGDGDELTAEAEPFTFVELLWTGAEDVESTLARYVTGQGLFDATYDPDEERVELIYTGERAADPERLDVQRFSAGPGTDEPSDRPFADAHDILTAGDSVTLEDVEHDERIAVVVIDEDEAEDEGHTRRHHLFQFTLEPRFAFRLDQREDRIVATYTEPIERNADEFRVLADDETASTQLEDEHETLDEGDEVDLGTYDVGTELVIEWTVPDEPIEIRSHVIVPDVEFDIEYEDGTVTIEHGGGDEIAADDITVHHHPTGDGPTAWDDDGTIEEGDTTTIDVDERPEIVYVVYRERELLDDRSFEE